MRAHPDPDQRFWAVYHRREFYDQEHPNDPGHVLNCALVYPGGFGEVLSDAEREGKPERIRARRVGRVLRAEP